jgi:hypothetical protein
MNCPSAMRLAKTLMQYMNSIRIYNTYIIHTQRSISILSINSIIVHICIYIYTLYNCIYIYIRKNTHEIGWDTSTLHFLVHSRVWASTHTTWRSMGVDDVKTTVPGSWSKATSILLSLSIGKTRGVVPETMLKHREKQTSHTDDLVERSIICAMVKHGIFGMVLYELMTILQHMQFP